MKNKTAVALRPQIIRRLQQAILDSGLTYHQIAERSGVSTFVISTYMMREPKMPTLETLAVLLPVLGVSADQVVLGIKHDTGKRELAAMLPLCPTLYGV